MTLLEWLPWLSGVGVILTIISLTAAAAAFFRATAARATIDIQGQTITALQQRLEQVVEEARLATIENVRVVAENVILREAVSGKAEIARLESLIDAHHRQVMEEHGMDRVSHEGRFDHLDRSLSDVKGLLSDRRGAV